jgi:pyruvate dehydrogenase E2 component (dihydrolipoamide acetyltransferase)
MDDDTGLMMSADLIKTLQVPSLGLSVEEVTIIDWLIAEGDSFETGDEICTFETEKTANVMEAPFAGTLRKIVAEVGDVLPVQATMALVADFTVSDEQLADYVANNGSTEAESASNTGVDLNPAYEPVAGEIPTLSGNAVTTSLAQGADDKAVHATPRARQLAAAYAVNLHNINGSGRNQRISRRDVERALAKADRAPAAVSQRRPVVSDSIAPVVLAPFAVAGKPLNSMRRKIAGRLQASKQTIPHYRLVIDVKMDALLKTRLEINEPDPELRISLNDLLLKACGSALIEVNEVNIQFDGENIYPGTDADIAVAVALESGLITPIVRAVQNKTLVEISSETRDLVRRAQSGSLALDEYQGGTFCVSNLGMYGVRQFDAIINPPHAAILAVGAVRESVVVDAGQAVVASILTLTLSCDHRVIDGAVGARFLDVLRQFIETPTSLRT